VGSLVAGLARHHFGFLAGRFIAGIGERIWLLVVQQQQAAAATRDACIFMAAHFIAGVSTPTAEASEGATGGFCAADSPRRTVVLFIEHGSIFPSSQKASLTSQI
jgi:hypothetical protein